jgi:hypothetical protein
MDVIDYLKDISKDITEIKVVQAKQEENLKNHMYRTELLEESNERLFEEIGPIKAHVNNVEGGLKLLGLASLVIGMIAGVIKIYSFFH